MEITHVESQKGVEDALMVRRTVFIDEQDVPVDRELDGKDDTAMHFVVYDGETPIGAARLRAYDASDTAKVERVAIIPGRRGEGLGRELMTAVEHAAIEAGFETIVLHAQVPVVPFYDALGYDALGPEFADAGIAHREMRKQLR